MDCPYHSFASSLNNNVKTLRMMTIKNVKIYVPISSTKIFLNNFTNINEQF